MTVLELLASLIDVWLPSHLSGEFVVAFLLSLCCLLTSFMCHASIWISAWLPSHLSGEFVVAFLPYLYCLVIRGSNDAPIFEMPSVPLG